MYMDVNLSSKVIIKAAGTYRTIANYAAINEYMYELLIIQWRVWVFCTWGSVAKKGSIEVKIEWVFEPSNKYICKCSKIILQLIFIAPIIVITPKCYGKVYNF